ncbi:MAG: AAA family ATPase, partial [Methylibium sp.]|nr:AAA family ATPase [Methylibium sp.]
AHLLYGVDGGGGFVLLSGEIGAGKTTVCRCFLEQIPKRCNVAYIFNPKLTVTELLKSVCDEFGIPYGSPGPAGATVKDYLDPLNEFLLKTHAVGQNNVLIIDEAQALSVDVLEQLRLLTNLETNERKLLQIILIGQPELRDMLARPELEQLAQRVIARYHLEALSEAETRRYIRHRLTVAGLKRARPFERPVMQRIHELSRGVPRRINLLCDRALLGAYASGKASVDIATVEKAAREVFVKPRPVADPRSRRLQLAMLGLGLLGGVALFGVVDSAMDGRANPATPRAGASASAASQPAAANSAAASAAASVGSGAMSTGASGAIPANSVLAAADSKRFFEAPLRDEGQAWRELAGLWKLELGEGDPCLAARRSEVHCHRGASSLALIRQLNRPGILTLQAEDGGAAYALLTGLSGSEATLRVGELAQTVPLVALAERWRGEFATLWRAPPGYENKVVEGGSGPVAEWLSAQLTSLQGRPQPGTADAALRSRIYAFQLAQGLAPDGLAGPITFMQLNRALGVEEPRLHKEN